MRITTWAGAGAIGLLLQAPIPRADMLMTVPQEDQWRFSTSPASASVSADGRYIALVSYARLVPADTDNRADIYVFDRSSGDVTLESVAADDQPLLGDSGQPRLSGDGRCLVFQTALNRADNRTDTDIVLRDRVKDTATFISRGTPHGGPLLSRHPSISEDCRLVVFASAGTDLVAGRDENGSQEDVYEFEAPTRTLSRISVDSTGRQPSRGASFAPAVSGNGNCVSFTSTANLAAGSVEANSGSRKTPEPQVYVRDLERGLTTRVSAGAGAAPLDGASYDSAISRDGRFVAFVSRATNLARGDRNRSADVFVRDLHDQSITLVSRRPDGGTANGTSGNPVLSADGRFVAFQSDASDLVCARRCPSILDDINLLPDVFLFDRSADRMTWVSALPSGGWAEESGGPQLDANATIVTFTSRHPIDDEDTRNDFDLFVRAPAAGQTHNDQRRGDALVPGSGPLLRTALFFHVPGLRPQAHRGVPGSNTDRRGAS